MVHFFFLNLASGLNGKNWTDSLIHTFEVDGWEILLTELLYSDRRETPHRSALLLLSQWLLSSRRYWSYMDQNLPGTCWNVYISIRLWPCFTVFCCWFHLQLHENFRYRLFICVGVVACLYITFWLAARELSLYPKSRVVCIQSSWLFCSLFRTCLITRMRAIFSGHLLLTCSQLIHRKNL